MTGIIKVDDLKDAGGNSIISSNGSGTFTYAAASGVNFTALNATQLTSGTIPAARIATASIANDLIDSAHYAAGSIDNAHIADGAIDSEHYADGSIDNEHIADDAIDSEHYAAGSIDTAHIADNQITLAKMDGLARGKIIYGNASGDPTALTVGSNGQALVSDGTDISWGSAGASTMNGLTDVIQDITNFTNSLLIQTNSDGSAPTTGTLSSANDNTGVGNAVFTDLTSGQQNSCFGNATGENLTGGSNNTLVGHYAGNSITTGIMNIGIGKGSVSNYDTEGHNIGIGENALGGSVAGGEYNIAIGMLAGDAITSADFNVLIGKNAGGAITTGANSVCIGYQADTSSTVGQNNVMVGYQCVSSGNNVHNQIVLGYNVTSVGEDNFSFGDGNTSRVYNNFSSNASWTRSSDERLKKEIETNEDCGLDFINDLRTVTFKWRPPSEYDESVPTRDEDKTEPKHKDKMYGFIAQEVKSSLDKFNIKDFNGWSEAPDTKIQGISYELFVMPLVKSIQELSAEVKELKAKLEDK